MVDQPEPGRRRSLVKPRWKFALGYLLPALTHFEAVAAEQRLSPPTSNPPQKSFKGNFHQRQPKSEVEIGFEFEQSSITSKGSDNALFPSFERLGSEEFCFVLCSSGISFSLSAFPSPPRMTQPIFHLVSIRSIC